MKEKGKEIFKLFRNADIVRSLAHKIEEEMPEEGLKLMHVCGSHEHTITYSGLRTLLPGNLELVAGPGCPVCVCSTSDIREAIEISRKKNVIMCTFGDMMRDRTPYGSLEDAKREGADVRMVYSPHDALALAEQNPGREVVFFGVGFETSSAPVAALALDRLPGNFSILTSLKRTSPAVEALLGEGGLALDGVIAPGHVSAIVGGEDWECIPKKYGIPTVVAGFEPVDVLLGIIDILAQIHEGRSEVDVEYKRLVKYEGNRQAQSMLSRAFEVREAHWRAMGSVPGSGYFLRKELEDFDARKRFGVRFGPETDKEVPPGCKCHLVVTGRAYPSDCPLFNERECTPNDPRGPCMVSGEGTCYIWFRYGGSAQRKGLAEGKGGSISSRKRRPHAPRIVPRRK